MISIYRSEASASLRRIPMWMVGSDGTTPPLTQAGGQAQITWYGRPAATVNCAATLSAISVLAGEYYQELSASEVSCLGMASVQYKAGAVLPTSTYFQVTNYDSGDSVRLGLFALPNAAAAAAGGLITVGTGSGQLNVSAGSVGLLAATHSGVTIDGVNRINSSVTPANALYSAITVRIDPQAYSGLTVEINNILPGNYSAVSFSITSSAGDAHADALLLRSIAGLASTGRLVKEALQPLRNRVLIDGSTMTVYSEDDQTSSWTASITTVADTSAIGGVNPAGGSA